MANEDRAYCKWLREQNCCACDTRPEDFPVFSASPITVHHHTKRRSFGRRAHDRDAMSLCARCHRNFHDARGIFRDWTREERTEWQDAQVARQRATYERECGLTSPGTPHDSEDIF